MAPPDPEPFQLPPTENAFDAKVLADIREHGWHCLTVAPEAHPEHPDLAPDPFHEAAFSYTVGLSLTLAHPELILVGRWAHAPQILRVIVDSIRQGQRLRPGEETDAVFPDRLVRFGAVSDRNRLFLLTYADWANNRRRFEAIQVIVQDQHNRWPQEPDYAGVPQPLLQGPQEPT